MLGGSLPPRGRISINPAYADRLLLAVTTIGENGKGTRSIRNLVDGRGPRQASGFTTGGDKPTVEHYGPAAVLASGTRLYWPNLPWGASGVAGSPCTAFWFGRVDAIPAGYYEQFIHMRGTRAFGIENGPNPFGDLQAYNNGGGSLASLATGTGFFGAGDTLCAIFTSRGPTDHELIAFNFTAGISFGSTSSTNGGSGVVSGAYGATIGFYGDGAGGYPGGVADMPQTVYLGALWDRGMSHADMVALRDDPWRVLRGTPRVYAVASLGAAYLSRPRIISSGYWAA